MTDGAGTTPGVHADIGTLVALRHRAGLFNFDERCVVDHPLTGRQMSRHRGRGLDFDELRHYQVGDDIRQLDWKVTRRMGEPFVRIYTEERHQDLILAVDQRVSMFFGSTCRMKSVTACEMAAVLAWNALEFGERIGALFVTDSRVEEVRPRRSRNHLMSLLHQLSALNLHLHSGISANALAMHTALRHLRVLANHDHKIWLISDLSCFGDEDKLLMADLAKRNSLSVAYIYDELESRLPETGVLRVSDGEQALTIDASVGSHLCRQAFAEKISGWTAFCRQHGIGLFPLHGQAPLLDQLSELFHAGS